MAESTPPPITDTEVLETFGRIHTAVAATDPLFYLPKLIKSAESVTLQNDYPALEKAATRLGEEIHEHPVLTELLLVMGRRLAQDSNHLEAAIHAVTQVVESMPEPNLALQAAETLLDFLRQPGLPDKLHCDIYFSLSVFTPGADRIKASILDQAKDEIIAAHPRKIASAPKKLKFIAQLLFKETQIELGRDPTFNKLMRRADALLILARKQDIQRWQQIILNP